MKKFLKRNFLGLMVVLIGLSVSWPLFAPGYFSHHDDLQVLRVYEVRECIQDLQLPCRWSKNLGFGNGFPVYNYYGVFPYYIGGLLSFVFGYVLSAKILFFIALFGGTVTMWLLSRELFGLYGGILATVLYTYAPYRALDVYVRGALAEAWSMMLMPLVMYGLYKLSRDNKQRWFLLSTVALFGLLTSHNIMTIFFGPLLVLWLVWCGWKRKEVWGRLVLSFGSGLTLSSFFLVPAFLEKGLIQSETLTRFDLDFRVHFVTVNQLFMSRFWGYGASVEGPWDGLSFQIGWPQWWMVVIGVLIVIIKIFKKIKSGLREIILICGLVIIFGISVFMTHNKSAFIWESLSILQFAQFPWRFLAVSILATSLIGGALMIFVDKNRNFWLGLIIVLTIIFNIGYFKPDKYFLDVNDSNKLSGVEWTRQISSIILDYLPKTAFEPREKAPDEPIISAGQISSYRNSSNKFWFNLVTDQDTKVEMPIFYFPGWEVQVNGQKMDINHDNLLGRISFDLPSGEYEIKGYFGDTVVRRLANSVSLIGLLMIGLYLYYAKVKRISI